MIKRTLIFIFGIIVFSTNVFSKDLLDGYYSKARSYSLKDDHKQAIHWHQKAAKGGHAVSQVSLGMFYYFGKGIVKNDKQAFYWFKKASEQGVERAQYNLGNMYFKGIGVVKNEKIAFQWYNKASSHKVIEPKYQVGHPLYGFAMYPGSQDDINLYKIAAESGYAAPQYYLGIIHQKRANKTKSSDWISKAALQNFATAQFELGDMYSKGLFVEQNRIKSMFWFNEAAEQGLLAAQARLGLIYASGKIYWHSWTDADYLRKAESDFENIVPKNRTKAYYWYRKAAEQGDSDSQYFVAMSHCRGDGAAINRKEAKQWMKKALKQNHPLAEESWVWCDLDKY